MTVNQAAVNAKVQDILQDLNAAIIAVNDGMNKIHQHDKSGIKSLTDDVITKDGELTTLLAA